MKHPIRRRLMYLAFLGLRAMVLCLPLTLARAIGRGLGGVAYLLLQDQRRLVFQHLGYAFGDTLSPARRRNVARRVFTNLGQTAVEWLLLPKLTAARLQQLVTCEGVEHVRRALAKGNGAIMLSPHFGNWEFVPLYLKALGFQGAVLARRLRYPEYESFLIGMRGARGIPTLARGSFKEVATLLRSNQVVGMMPDQDIDSLEGIFVTFFGHPAHTPVGPAALSVMTGAPLLPCFAIREGKRFRLVIEPALGVPDVKERTQAVAQLTQTWSTAMESYIRRFPDQWVWMHRRWKTQPVAAATRDKGQATGQEGRRSVPEPLRATAPALVLFLIACHVALVTLCGGCAKPSQPMSATTPGTTAAPSASSQTTDPSQRMSGFSLTGYEVDGAKRWELEGQGASVEGEIVTIHHPDAVGYDLARTAYLTASVAQVNQTNRHVRLEHDVTIHTSEGLWLTSPVLHWIPDQNQMATDQPVRIETDHMLLRGRGARGLTQLKQATLFSDIELVLNPSDHERPEDGAKQVTITCDGPLSFDYEHHIATFERNVHVHDPNGELYSDKLIAYLSETTHTIRYAEAIGKVRIHQNQNTALSERAVYEPAIGKITLVGKPSLLVYPSQGREGTPLSFGGLAASPKEPANDAADRPTDTEGTTEPRAPRAVPDGLREPRAER